MLMNRIPSKKRLMKAFIYWSVMGVTQVRVPHLSCLQLSLTCCLLIFFWRAPLPSPHPLASSHHIRLLVKGSPTCNSLLQPPTGLKDSSRSRPRKFYIRHRNLNLKLRTHCFLCTTLSLGRALAFTERTARHLKLTKLTIAECNVSELRWYQVWRQSSGASAKWGTGHPNLT